jgi:hypothetical protein
LRTFHPGHGPHDPATGTPPQRAGSLRRTTTIDLLHPDGLGGDVVLDGRGRDLTMGRDEGPRTVGVAALLARIDFMDGCTLREIRTEPDDAGVRGLLGSAVASGFRAKVAAAVPQAAADRSLVHLLLDDMPGAVLVSGYARHPAAATDMGADPALRRSFAAGRTNLCAGFSESGTMLVELSRTGVLPLPVGPAAPRLESPDQPLAWHDFATLPPDGIRRRRRLDVLKGGDRLHVDAMFRDTHRDGAGRETVIHEYELTAEIDRADLRVLAIEAVPRVLPWMECPHAAVSAGSLVGQTVHDLRSWVRGRLSGTASCTHLNDLLRSLADIDRLVEEL